MKDTESRIKDEFNQRWKADKAITISRKCEEIEDLINQPRYKRAVGLAIAKNIKGEYVYSDIFLAGSSTASLMVNILRVLEAKIIDDAEDEIEYQDLRAEDDRIIEETMT